MYGDRRRTDHYWFHNFEVKERYNPATRTAYQEELPAYNRSYEDWRYLGNYSFSPVDHTTITLNTRYFKNYTGLGRTENLPVNRDSQNRGEVGLLGLNIKSTPSDRLDLVFRAYARQYTDKLWNESSYLETIFIPFPPPGRFVTIPRFVPGYFRAIYRDYFAEAQSTMVLGSHNTLTGGLDFLSVDVNFDPILNKDTGSPLPGAEGAKKGIHTVGFYLQDEIRFGNLNIIPGVRVDKHSLFEAVVSPKLGISYRLWENTTLRASAGRAYRAPSVTELFRPAWNLNPAIKLRPNPNLKPEYIWSADGGFEHYFSPNLRVSLDGFYNNMKDFIVTPPVPGEPGFIQYQNLNKSWSAGLEAAKEIDALRLAGLADRHPYALSSGQQRRVTLAAALARKPQILLLDEPTVGQDDANLSILPQRLAAYVQEGGTLVTATHDVRAASFLGQQVLILAQGRRRRQRRSGTGCQIFPGGGLASRPWGQLSQPRNGRYGPSGMDCTIRLPG